MNASAVDQQTIDPKEAAHFGALAADWWDPNGSSAMLHKLNPVRLRFVREQIDAHWHNDSLGFKPLAGKSVLDVGCGAGLLSEPLARMGGSVTAVDASPENIAAAKVHAASQRLDICYSAGEVASVVEGRYDLVVSMEVIEHVDDPAIFLQALVDRLAPGGLLLLSTPNRTAKSRLLMVELAERFGQIPRGTHDWDKFITPDELVDLLIASGMHQVARSGLVYSRAHGFQLSDDLSLDYLVAATTV